LVLWGNVLILPQHHGPVPALPLQYATYRETPLVFQPAQPAGGTCLFWFRMNFGNRWLSCATCAEWAEKFVVKTGYHLRIFSLVFFRASFQSLHCCCYPPFLSVPLPLQANSIPETRSTRKGRFAGQSPYYRYNK
jgi:hypothetical protein